MKPAVSFAEPGHELGAVHAGQTHVRSEDRLAGQSRAVQLDVRGGQAARIRADRSGHENGVAVIGVGARELREEAPEVAADAALPGRRPEAAAVDSDPHAARHPMRIRGLLPAIG